MTSRPSTTVTGPWAALMTRSGRYRCFALRSSISASTKPSGFLRVVIRLPLPVHDDLPGVADRAAAKAASNWVCGKRCVITGLMSRPALTSTAIWYHVSYIWRP